MANNDIKQKIVLEGEKEYKAALKDAQRELRTLRSELKAETAELGKNATEQQKAEVKRKNLQKQIKEQEKVVQTYKKALEEVKEKYGDDADAIAKWEIKLNDARTTLANMKNDLDGVGNSFKKVEADAAMGTVAAKSYADAIGSIANAGAAVSDAIEGIFSGMVNTVRNTIGELWADIMDLAGRANAWGDIAGFWNTDAAKIQQWERAVRGATDDFADLTSAVLRINNMDDKQQKTIAEWTGVSGVNYSDRWDYATKVLDEMSKLPYDKMLKASEAIFGAKRATGVMDLLGDWDTIQKNLERFDAENGGLGLTNEQIEEFISIDERVANIKETWRAFLDSFEAEHFGHLALELTGNAQAILDSFISFMNAENESDREKALDEFTKNIEEFFKKIGEAIAKAAEALDQVGNEFKQSENGYLRLLGGFLTTISELLKWFSESTNIDTVISAFETLAAFWVTGKGLQFIGKIAELAAHIKTIKSYNGLNALLNGMGGGGAGNAVATGAGAATGGAVKGGLAAGLGSLLATPAALGVGAFAGVSLFAYAMGEKHRHEDWDEYIANEQAMNAMDEVPEILQRLYYATEGLDENGNESFEGGAAEKLFEEYGNDFLKLLPDSDFWKKAEQMVDLSDGLSSDEIKNIIENGFTQVGLFSDDWQTLNKDLYNLLMQRYNEMDHTDLPADWWKTTGSDENGITRQDLTAFNAIPEKMKGAVAQGVSNIRVTMDGYTVGHLVAPYVSQFIARDMMV